MKYQKLGNTNIKVSQICLGCWALAGDKVWGPQKESDSIRTVHEAVDTGINFFDSAELYGDGRSEEILGKALSKRRERVIIATKVNPKHLFPAELRRACEASLRRLKTDYIDLYYIHFPNPQVYISETSETLVKLKEEGKIRAIGVSNFGKQDLQKLLPDGRTEVNQLPYNLLWRVIEYEILPFCIQNEIGVICYSSLSQGLLTGKFHSPDEVPLGRARTRHFSGDRPLARHGEKGAESETFSAIEDIRNLSKQIGMEMVHLALGWLLTRKGVISIIVGARNPDQIKRNAKAVKLKLSFDVIAKLTNITEELKEKLGLNADMWESSSKSRIG